MAKDRHSDAFARRQLDDVAATTGQMECHDGGR
jgi:hypothetical protein